MRVALLEDDHDQALLFAEWLRGAGHTCECFESGKAFVRNIKHDSFDALIKPGSSDEPAITPGKPDASELYKLLISADKDERMPRKADPLPPAAIAAVRKWIEQGAKYDAGDPKAALISILPPVEHPAAPTNYARPIPITALAFSPDGAALLAAGHHEITVWNTTDGKLIRRIGNLPQRVEAFAFHPDGSTLAVAGGTPGESGEVRLIHFADGKLMAVLANTADVVLDVKFSRDGKHIASGGADGVVRVFETDTRRQQLTISQHSDWVMAVAFSADGNRLASASRDKSAKIYQLAHADTAGNSATGTPAAATSNVPSVTPGTQIGGFTDHNDQVFAVAFAPDGNSVFTGGRDRRVMHWNIADAKRLGEMGGGEVHELIISGDDLLAAFSDNNLRHFNAKDRGNKRTFSGLKDTPYCLAYHSATKRIAGGAHDGSVVVWDFEKGTPVTQFVAAPGMAGATGAGPGDAPKQGK